MVMSNSDEKLKELQTWLKTLPTHSIERQTCGSAVLEPEVIEEVEKIVDGCPKSQIAKKVTMQIKPSFLYRVRCKGNIFLKSTH
ncbi:hypothetical protein NQ314_020866 [Rhamnusium bicolor]|uniref:Uncharacterized protein n=1 Tax=Rhamnusium bicolor TaxID=1586634 RepID=A0AAV8WJX2_9CUCU|nr:hypothetical protein NQ314_020866 [Rhamnusium bicolor]